MNKLRTTLRNLHADQIEGCASSGTPFDAASMSGVEGYHDTGRLDEFWAELYRSERNDVTYTVLSYATPIAWRSARDGRWVVVTQKFSQSTSQHQSIVRGLRPQRVVPTEG